VKFSVGVFVDCLISMEKMDCSAIFSEKSGIFKYSAKTVEDIYTLPFTIKTIDLFGLKTCEYEYSWRNTDLLVHFLRKKIKTTRMPTAVLEIQNQNYFIGI
jgi:hypothetical protein